MHEGPQKHQIGLSEVMGAGNIGTCVHGRESRKKKRLKKKLGWRTGEGGVAGGEKANSVELGRAWNIPTLDESEYGKNGRKALRCKKRARLVKRDYRQKQWCCPTRVRKGEKKRK